MNPENRSKTEITVNTLMQLGMYASATIAVLIIAILGFYASPRLAPGANATGFVIVVASCAIVALIAILLFNFFLQRKIRDRLLELVEVCRHYAEGDRGVRALVNGDDEFAALALSLNTLLEVQGSFQNASSSFVANDAAALQAQIEKLLQEVSAVGDGDLRVQAEVTPDTLGVLADSFNYMIEELAKVVGRVQVTAAQVTNATRRILDRSAELAQASETQVSQISQTSNAVEALASFVQSVAHNAQLSAEAAQDALRNAKSGQQSVRQSIEGMLLIRENVQETAKKIKRLGERSNEIGEIVRIIEDIADQTNLLALNAAIQSAMAGEHGRGFAVVAEEIRLLAERSTESTKRIATLVKSIQGDTYEAVVAMEDSTQEVVKGSQLADEAGRALNSIYTAVERQAQMIEGIAHAAHEQTSVSQAVAVAMTRISEITSQTNVGAQEAAASVSYLADLSDQMRASVSTFRLPEQGNEMLGAFPTISGPVANDNQWLAPNSSPSGNQAWGQPFAPAYQPFAEAGNMALSSQGGQPGFAITPDFQDKRSFANQSPFGSQPGFGRQPFAAQPSFPGQTFGKQPFNSQPGFPEQSFNNQPDYAEQSFGTQLPFNNQPDYAGQAFGTQQPFSNQQEYGEFADFQNGQYLVEPFQPGSNNQSYSSFPLSQPGHSGEPTSSGPLQPQQPGQPAPAQSRAQRPSRQPLQGQPPNSYGQGQIQFPNNGTRDNR